ncbi:hypothetical protein ACFW95_00360 [Streptomyces sp. NPDC059474]|uniref:hypothetical protein n=1 Tax=Streptomyces sp. NPDC059474 TaxID=3346846 RepID=UPI0036B328B7
MCRRVGTACRRGPERTPGAHIDLLLGNGLERQYSLCSTPQDPHIWRVGILGVPDGRGGSRHVHDTLWESRPVRVRGPRNNFPPHPAGPGRAPRPVLEGTVDHRGSVLAPSGAVTRTAVPTASFDISDATTYTRGVVTWNDRSVTVTGEHSSLSTDDCRATWVHTFDIARNSLAAKTRPCRSPCPGRRG